MRVIKLLCSSNSRAGGRGGGALVQVQVQGPHEATVLTRKIRHLGGYAPPLLSNMFYAVDGGDQGDHGSPPPPAPEFQGALVEIARALHCCTQVHN